MDLIADIQEKRYTLKKNDYFRAKADVIDETKVISSECKYIEELIKEGMSQKQIRKVKNYRFSMQEILPLL